MDIAAVIMSALALVAVIIWIFLTVKKNNNQPEINIDLKEIGAIQKQL